MLDLLTTSEVIALLNCACSAVTALAWSMTGIELSSSLETSSCSM